jgi:CheY-like chemotaxis protein
VTLKVEALESPTPNIQSPIPNTQYPISNIQFTIQDTGVGIAPDDLEIMFDQFQQVGDVKNRPAGTGLGLSISRSLVELMGGNLHVASPPSVPPPGGEVKGRAGSVFWFDLALPVVDPGASAAAPARGQIIGVKDKAPRILVVDDNRENRGLLAAWLSPLGFQVIKASSGREGLDKAAELRPDAVIIDLFMPEMDGLEVMRRLRQSPAWQDAPDTRPVIIATSASVHERDQQKSLAAGSDAFLPKPIDFDLLFEQLQSLLELEWLYQAAPAASKPEPGDLVLPPEEVLRALLDSTMMGDVTRLNEQLADMRQADEKFAPLAAQLQPLAQQFKFNTIRALLQGHLEM